MGKTNPIHDLGATHWTEHMRHVPDEAILSPRTNLVRAPLTNHEMRARQQDSIRNLPEADLTLTIQLHVGLFERFRPSFLRIETSRGLVELLL